MKILENDFNISRHISIESQFIGNHYTPEQSHYTIPISDTEIKELNMFLEAWIEWFRIHGERGNYHDGGRRRDIVEDIKNPINYRTMLLSIWGPEELLLYMEGSSFL